MADSASCVRNPGLWRQLAISSYQPVALSDFPPSPARTEIALALDVYRILRANCDNTRRLAALHQQDIAIVSGSLWARVGNPIDRRHIQVGDDSLPALPVHREAPCRQGSAGVASRCRCWLALAVFHCASLPILTECKVCAGRKGVVYSLCGTGTVAPGIAENPLSRICRRATCARLPHPRTPMCQRRIHLWRDLRSTLQVLRSKP